MAKHIFLIGFMGSGKTYWGRQLAAALERPFVDTDDRVEAFAGKKIADIFREGGEGLFRQMESRTLEQLSEEPDSVVATGGGMPCFNGNLERMKQNGKVIYLKMPPEILYGRLENAVFHRPVLAGSDPSDLRENIRRLLELRAPAYEQADVVLEYEAGEDGYFWKL